MPQSPQTFEQLRAFSVRLPESLAQQIDQIAKEQVRSGNYIVNVLVREALAARIKKQAKKVPATA